jgi:hypothetical protein
MAEKKNTGTVVEPKSIQQSPAGVTTAKQPEAATPPTPPEPGISPAPPEPVIPPVPSETEDWRMNREWCLNQALDIVKSLKFEVKDVPAFLETVYRKIVELANDARRGKNA